MTPRLRPIVALDDLPFHLGHRSVPSNSPFPDVLPFAAGIEEQTGVLVQSPNLQVSGFLERAYGCDSILGTPMDDTPLGRGYAEDFLKFLCSIPGLDFADHPRVLEIGCGTGYLLHRIAQLGGDVIGIEPGREGQIGAERYGVSIRRGVFDEESAVRLGRFDLILTYAVMEHVEALDSFVRLQVEHLSDNGVIAAAVPDEAQYYDSGDLSMFIHEHWSYFTEGTLVRCLAAQDLQIRKLEKAGYGASLYVAAIAGRGDAEAAAICDSDHLRDLIPSRLTRFRDYLDNASRGNRSVGLYCPSRALNLLYLAAPAKLPRFFDDDQRLHGMFYPPFSVAIEPRQGLFERPVDELLIMSRTFGQRLANELSKHPSMQGTEIVLLGDILPASGETR